jgi:hypothetical protein
MLATTDPRNGSVQDDNGCRWEWKFTLDADRRPELRCRCQTCGVKYYLSRWQWTLDSDRDGKCLPPTGTHGPPTARREGNDHKAAPPHGNPPIQPRRNML